MPVQPSASLGTTVHGKGRTPQHQHGRHHRAAEEAAAGPGGHRRAAAALVLLWQAADGQDAPTGHQDPEGLCHPGHRQLTGVGSPQTVTHNHSLFAQVPVIAAGWSRGTAPQPCCVWKKTQFLEA